MSRKCIVTAAVIAIAALSIGAGFAFAQTKGQAVKVDPALKSYAPVSGVSGTIKGVGSDTMNNLMALWGEDFRKFYPNVNIEVEGKGSSTAPPALISGTSTFGPMSRAMKGQELDDFEARYGYKPAALRTSIDMLAVYVHKDNPIQSLTLQQIDAIFSKTRKGGAEEDVTTWGQLGLTGEWADKPVSLYGRNSASGTYGFFKEHALFKGDFKDSVKEQPGSASVVQAVASDKYGIGYSGIGYMTADVRAVPLKNDASSPVVPAAAEHAYDGTYPLARFLYLYLNYQPGSELDPLRAEFIKYVFSKEGQADVIKDGYYPVTAKIAAADLASIGINP
ncbi:MAG: Phosphate transporter, periplasmic phosphate-binding protein PstS [Candidatus Krumholzibacteriota bacterium]|jgi:phosphate transport system substrate-binding protein|nr:Phosphate transporter, periplasmic phosphate-binding protein PstS [Candidatus Krumholzibacteriota bacterium]